MNRLCLYPKMIRVLLAEAKKIPLKCEICHSNKNLSIHHKNENINDCKSKNLQLICNSCHMKYHQGKKRKRRLKVFQRELKTFNNDNVICEVWGKKNPNQLIVTIPYGNKIKKGDYVKIEKVKK